MDINYDRLKKLLKANWTLGEFTVMDHHRTSNPFREFYALYSEPLVRHIKECGMRVEVFTCDVENNEHYGERMFRFDGTVDLIPEGVKV